MKILDFPIYWIPDPDITLTSDASNQQFPLSKKLK